MDAKDLIVGKWYIISNYGSDSNIRAKLVEVVKDIAYMKFYWGGLFRSTQSVNISRIYGQCKKPGLFSN